MNVEQLDDSPWFHDLIDLVQEELDRRKSNELRDRPNLEHDLEQVRDRMAGLRESLANRTLAVNVRQCLEADLGELLDSEADLRQKVQADKQRPESVRELVDPEKVLERLKRLEEVLRSGNPSEVNVELSHIVDRIECSSDGTVMLRLCPVGIAPSAVEAGSPPNSKGEAPPIHPEGTEPIKRGTARRRSIRRVEDRDAAHFVADPNRFQGVPENWFWTETFRQPRRKSWAEMHADEVHLAKFAPDGTVKATFTELEQAFGRTKPTLRKAIRIAEERRRQGGQDANDDAA